MKTIQKETQSEEIRALFCINTPAQAHTWRFVIEGLKDKGYKFEILARDYGSTPELLDSFGLPYTKFQPFAWKFIRIFEILIHLKEGWKASRRLDPTVIIGFGVDAALIAAMLGKPCILFTDMEPVKLQNILNKMFASIVITPECYKGNFGKKHLRIQGYKELFYLHPNRFQPDPGIFTELGIKKGEKYALLRFNAIDSVHDIGRHGLSLEYRYRLVRELEKYCRVFISPEDDIPTDLQGYILPVNPERIHQVLKYAWLYVGDGGTMAVEAALLGTPAILFGIYTNGSEYVNDLLIFGNFDEMVHRYHLIQEARNVDQALEKAYRILGDENSKTRQMQMTEDVIKSKIDATGFMLSFIENFHREKMKERLKVASI